MFTITELELVENDTAQSYIKWPMTKMGPNGNGLYRVTFETLPQMINYLIETCGEDQRQALEFLPDIIWEDENMPTLRIVKNIEENLEQLIDILYQKATKGDTEQNRESDEIEAQRDKIEEALEQLKKY